VSRARLPISSKKAGLVNLNLHAMAELRRFRPQLVLAGHIWGGPTLRVAKSALKTPAALYLHADEVTAHPRLAALAMRAADVSIAVSRHTRELARACGADPERVRIISPGVDLPELPATAQGRDSRPTVLTVARLTDRYKGHDVLLHALEVTRERVPSVRWVVVGDGPLRRDLEAQATSLGLGEHVSFLGALPDSKRDAWLDRAHVFAMPSRLPPSEGGEGFGIVYLEAAAHGLPVVAGNVGGAVDAVVDGETGLLVDPADPRAIGDALARLLVDPVLARRMGDAGAARARKFAWPVIARRVETVLTDVLRPAPRSAGIPSGPVLD
jgi:phosphatidyl-myo-inositol dimannoside synthase